MSFLEGSTIPAPWSGGAVVAAHGSWRDGLVITLRRGGSLSGRVLDPQRGTGIPNASVSWRASGDGGGGAMGFMARMGGGGSTDLGDGPIGCGGTTPGSFIGRSGERRAVEPR